MNIDAQLYRKSLEYYRQWNDAELKARHLARVNETPNPSAEDLIIQKVVAGRDKDWPGVEALLVEQWGRLDQEYIEDWLSQFAEALDKPAILGDHLELRRRTERLLFDHAV